MSFKFDALGFNETEESEPQMWNTKLTKVILPCAIGGAAILAAPFALSAVGFGAGGIVGGSVAAKLMSAAAIANGGGVAAGSTIALLQSAGAAGMASFSLAAIGGATAGVTAAVQAAVSQTQSEKTDSSKEIGN